MQIQWFPGHMHKAQKEIRQVLSGIDVVIELLDARIPFSSQNPMLADIRGQKPCIKLLHKSDLADSNLTAVWVEALEAQANTQVIVSNANNTAWVKTIPTLCRKITPIVRETRPVHVLIVGIPNVGKSTVINLLAGRTIARTGNEPAITKAQQRVDIGNGVVLRDTPGVLWPNLDNINSGFRLAITGAIKDTAIDSADVAAFAADYLAFQYPQYLQQRYGVQRPEGLTTEWDAVNILEQIGHERGTIARGGLVDFDRVGKLLLTEIRAGVLGPMTLETPPMMNAELQQLAVIRAQRELKENKRKEQRKHKRQKSKLKKK